MLSLQRKACLFDIINMADTEQVLPSLLTTDKGKKSFAKFLKI